MSKHYWMSEATKNKGGLHRALHLKMSHHITAQDLSKAHQMGGKADKEANLARTLMRLRKR